MFSLVALVMVVVGYLVNGIALMLLWAWFMVPTLKLPELSLPAAIGIGIVISFLTQQYIPKNEKQKIEAFVIEGFLLPIFSIIVGWIVHLFM